MFLNLKPLPGDWNLLVLAFGMTIVAGCASLQPGSSADTTPVVTAAAAVEGSDDAGIAAEQSIANTDTYTLARGRI